MQLICRARHGDALSEGCGACELMTAQSMCGPGRVTPPVQSSLSSQEQATRFMVHQPCMHACFKVCIMGRSEEYVGCLWWFELCHALCIGEWDVWSCKGGVTEGSAAVLESAAAVQGWV